MRARFHAALIELSQLDKSDRDAALRRIIAVDADVMQVARVSYWELSSGHDVITCKLLYERDTATFADGGQLRATDFPAYFEALVQCRVIAADDAWTDDRTCEFVEPYFKLHDIHSMLDVPVWRRGKLAGVLCHETVGSARAWSTDEQAFATGIANMIAVAVEASERRRAEEGYALLAKATNDVLWDWDLERDVIEWNDAMLRVFRYRAEDVLPSHRWWLDRVHPEDRARVERAIAQALEMHTSGWSDQYRWIRGDGSVAVVLDRGQVVRDASGVALRMVGSMLDISARVEMEARLALSDRMASIGTLASGVAHEINNPLTYVIANLSFLEGEIDGGNFDKVALLAMVREAQEGADRVRRIVRDLQVFSRPQEDEVVEVDVAAVIESSINMTWNQIRHRAQLVRSYGAVDYVRMNRARLGQVLLNLLVNAAQAIEDGNVTKNQITVRTFTDPAGHVVIEVHDTGCGIAADVQARIFEPFFTTKQVGVGTGLGLSICHSIVTAARGRLEIDSTPGRGTRVRAILPAATPVVAAPAPVVESTARRRVLLVDDEPAIRRAMQRVLEAEHQVVVADSGAAALVCIDVQPFDVVVCDLMMPRMSGMELYRRLVDQRSPLAERMIFMTGGTFSKDSSDFVTTCIQPMVAKPVDRQALARAFISVGA